jgi:SpoVK/Ycf46/Vps4 family AAA+-type ATPase
VIGSSSEEALESLILIILNWEMFVTDSENAPSITSLPDDQMTEQFVKKGFDDLFLSEENKRILGLVDEWRSNRVEYHSLRILYKISFMLSGPPGNGKTSFASVLSNHLKCKFTELIFQE